MAEELCHLDNKALLDDEIEARVLYTATSHITAAARKKLKDVGIKPADLRRVYKTARVRHHGSLDISSHTAEAWDYFTTQALIAVSQRPFFSADQAHMWGWLHSISEKFSREPDTSSVYRKSVPRGAKDLVNLSRSGTPRGAISGAYAVLNLSIDFAVWCSRLPNKPLSKHGGELLSSMLASGTTEAIMVPGLIDRTAGIMMPHTNVSVPVYVDKAQTVYSPHLLRVWGSEDVRMLGFYRAGVVDAAAIKGYLSNGVDADLAEALG